MQTFKIDNYEREHGRGTFMRFRHLSQNEAERIKETVRKFLNVRDDASATDVLQAIQQRSFLVAGVNADDEHFDLGRVLDELNFETSGATYLNWYHFDDVDEMQTHEIIASFSDIWYPASDDLDLIDARMRWVLSIHHSGAITGLKLGGEP